jgi:hypothetical protein
LRRINQIARGQVDDLDCRHATVPPSLPPHPTMQASAGAPAFPAAMDDVARQVDAILQSVN